ncbi:hypothetical protein ACFL6N_04595 [Thermodesulfobacteriota bacterium]
MRDYSKRYSSVCGRRQKVLVRKSEVAGEREFFSRVISIVVLGILFLGFGFGLWLGKATSRGLEELALSDQVNNRLVLSNRQLTRELQECLEENRINQRAQEFGLYPPTKDQRRGIL